MDTMTTLLLVGVGYIVLFRPDIIDGLIANLPAAPASAPATSTVPVPSGVVSQIAVGEQNPSTPAEPDDEEPAADEKPAADTKKTSTSTKKTSTKSGVAYAWYNQNRNRIDYTRYPNYFENQRKITIA